MKKERSWISVKLGILRVYWWRFQDSDALAWLRRTARGVTVFVLLTLAFVLGMLMPVAGVALALLAVSIAPGEY